MPISAIICGLILSQVAIQPPLQVTSSELAVLDKFRNKAVEKWEKEIVELEKLDARQPDPDQPIRFVCSSSIRRWTSIAILKKHWKLFFRRLPFLNWKKKSPKLNHQKNRWLKTFLSILRRPFPEPLIVVHRKETKNRHRQPCFGG